MGRWTSQAMLVGGDFFNNLFYFWWQKLQQKNSKKKRLFCIFWGKHSDLFQKFSDKILKFWSKNNGF